MNSSILKNIISFIALILLQALIFNNINLFGYLNPYIYIVWVFLFPIRKKVAPFLILSFLLGLSIDFFFDSGGINAAATLFIAFIRLPLLKAILRKSEFDYMLFNLRATSFSKTLFFITALTIIHHFIVFSLEYFSFKSFTTVIANSLLTSVFTIVLILLGITLFTKKI